MTLEMLLLMSSKIMKAYSPKLIENNVKYLKIILICLVIKRY